MRILYATLAYKPAYRIGGPILSVAAVAERLARRGHEVTVVTSNSNLDEDLDVPLETPVLVDGVRVWYFGRREVVRRARMVPYLAKSVGFLYSPTLRAALDRLVPPVDLVHTHIPFVYPTYAAARAARRHGKPHFYHQRGVLSPRSLAFRRLKKRFYIRAIERRTLREATTLVALTDAEVASYRALGVDTPCRVVPNGIDVAEYRTRPRTDPLVRWHVPPDAPVVLFLGRVHPTKGAERLLHAFVQIRHAYPDAVLVLAGPDEWGLERRFLETAHAAGMADRVVFAGMVSGETKLDLLARADLFCLPSESEGFSMAVLEALASATPVLLSPGCNFPRVAEAGAGRIAENTAEATAAALSDLLRDRAALGAMGAAGRELVRIEYDWDGITDRMIEVYHEGIRRYGARR